MSKDDDKANSTELQVSDLESQIIEEILDVDITDSQPIVAHYLQVLGSEHEGSELELLLKSFWNYSEALRLVAEEGNFLQSIESAEAAANGFNQIGFEELESTSRAFSAYAYAITELHKLNVGRYLELHSDLEEYLRKAGRFGLKLQPMIDHLKPEAEFVSGIQALQLSDSSTAKTLINQAAEGSVRLADKYYEKGTQLHFTFLGLGKMYTSFLTYFIAQQDLTNLELDSSNLSSEIIETAKEAEKLLSQADLDHFNVRIAYQLSRAITELTEVTTLLRIELHRCLQSTFKPDRTDFLALLEKTRQAMEYLSNAGPNATPLIRMCDQLLVRIKNLQRLSKPNKKDFGVYSGLISCALFVPLFIISSYATHSFGFQVDAKILLSTTFGLALIGGFGFGATKFRHFIFTSDDAGGDKD